MRISNVEVTDRYARRRPDINQYLPRWTRLVDSANWRTPQEAETSSNSVRHIGQGLLAFNVGNNRYRIVAFVDYRTQSMDVRFIGTHDEYERAMARGVWR